MKPRHVVINLEMRTNDINLILSYLNFKSSIQGLLCPQWEVGRVLPRQILYMTNKGFSLDEESICFYSLPTGPWDLLMNAVMGVCFSKMIRL